MLRCPICGREYEDHGKMRCDCGEPLEFEPFRGRTHTGKSVWERFREFLPVEPDLNLSLGEGDTPLVKSRLGKELGVRLHLKNETVNPTWSFKDRGTFLGILAAMKFGYRRVGTVSTGNMAASVAAYAARAGLKAYILVSSSIAPEKITQIAAYGSEIIKVEGPYGELYYKSLEAGEKEGIYFINSDNPFRIEGYKTISFEIAEEMSPDYVIVPTSSGGLIRGIIKGFLELRDSGLVGELPTFIAVQAEGCSPVHRAFIEGKSRVERFKNPHTVAHAIENPYPPSGNAVLKLLRETGGFTAAVNDREILKAREELAREGLFVQPASATGIAAVKRLAGEGRIEEGAKVVSILTGSGLKALPATGPGKVRGCRLEELEDCLKTTGG
ncbi:threonine synthase [Thermococcus atlanticus]